MTEGENGELPGEGQGSQPGEGENQGEGQEGKKGPNGWVPKVRLDEVIGEVHGLKSELQKEREERIRLEERLKQEPKKEVRYTRAQLLEAVSAGQITQAQADEHWEQQMRTDIRKELSNELRETTSATERQRVVKDELKQYKSLVPGLMDAGSENRQKVSEEFRYLTELGAPSSMETELAALRAAFGPIDKLQKKQTPRSGHEPHVETGGKGGGNGGQGKTAFDQLPQRYRDHYQRMIDRGMYSGKEDPKLLKEVARIKPDVLKARAAKYS